MFALEHLNKQAVCVRI